MKRTVSLALIGLFILTGTAFGQEVYRWRDEKGVVHFTDDPTQIPEKYRSQVQQKAPSKESTPPQPISPRPVKPPARNEPQKVTPEGQEANQKDALGRGEEWWRGKAREWNGKLSAAQKNYENAYAQWKSKEQELEASKLKPHSVQRKLKAEVDALEEKAKDWEKQMNEAKNMVENILPKEASDYRANPEWLKVEEKR